MTAIKVFTSETRPKKAAFRVKGKIYFFIIGDLIANSIYLFNVYR